MSKPCPSCGAELAKHASFCPYCETIIAKKITAHPYHPRQKKLLLAVLGALSICLILALGFFLLPKEDPLPSVQDPEPVTEPAQQLTAPEAPPEEVTASLPLPGNGAQYVYEDDTGSYWLYLSFNANATSPQASEHVQISQSSNSGKPSVLYVVDADTGKNAAERFWPQVNQCSVSILSEQDTINFTCSEPMENENFPNAARMSHLVFSSNSGTTHILWTLKLENGETIQLFQTLTVIPLDTIVYSYLDTPMDTIEELHALLSQLRSEAKSNTVYELYLAPVVYEGGIDLTSLAVNLYGTSRNDSRTTFTDTLIFRTELTGSNVIRDIDFIGSGGTGILSSASVCLYSCNFSGWDIAIDGEYGSWPYLENCTFSHNGIGLYWNSNFSYSACEAYSNLAFIENEIAIQAIAVPGNGILRLIDCVFTGNQCDLDNQSGATLDLSQSTIQ